MEIKPIAYIKNGFDDKFGIPRQSGMTNTIESKIIFSPEFRDENAIRGIEQYSHLWLIWGFSENEGQWSPTVRPPKLGGNTRVGVFATRSPFRPNSMGLSCVRLEKIEDSKDGKIIIVTGADLKNETPIYDIKPYLPYVDKVDDATGGFSEEHKNDLVQVVFSDGLNGIEPVLKKQLTEILSYDPRPSYQHDENRVYCFDFNGYKVKFMCDGKVVTVTEVKNDIHKA